MRIAVQRRGRQPPACGPTMPDRNLNCGTMRYLVRVVLFHNEDAGDGSSVHEITSLLKRHGHRLVQVVDKELRVEQIVASQPDLVVAAGGDGTVATVARVLAGRKLPFAILPLGTANNIAKSL